MTVPSVRSSGLLNPIGAVVTAVHVPPEGGGTDCAVACGAVAGRRGNCAKNLLQASGFSLKNFAFATLSGGGITPCVCVIKGCARPAGAWALAGGAISIASRQITSELGRTAPPNDWADSQKLSWLTGM